MTQFIRDYLLSVVAVALLSSAALSIVPKGTMHKTLMFLCGLIMILVAIKPVTKIDFADLSNIVDQAKIDVEKSLSGTTVNQQQMVGAIIKEQAETYILDKAADLGFAPTVSVQIQYGEDYPYPYSAEISGCYTDAQRQQLTYDLVKNLAIPEARQEWNANEE